MYRSKIFELYKKFGFHKIVKNQFIVKYRFILSDAYELFCVILYMIYNICIHHLAC